GTYISYVDDEETIPITFVVPGTICHAASTTLQERINPKNGKAYRSLQIKMRIALDEPCIRTMLTAAATTHGDERADVLASLQDCPSWVLPPYRTTDQHYYVPVYDCRSYSTGDEGVLPADFANLPILNVSDDFRFSEHDAVLAGIFLRPSTTGWTFVPNWFMLFGRVVPDVKQLPPSPRKGLGKFPGPGRGFLAAADFTSPSPSYSRSPP
ncbi:hypothetical protein HDU96_004139, partial [Phlyctochytrium bullatum]